MNRLKNKIESLSLNYKKEMTYLIIGNIIIFIIIITLFILKINIIGILISFGLLILFNYFSLNKYSKLEKENKDKLDQSFIEIFSYLKIYLSNGETVYQSLKEVNVFVDDNIESYIDKLIKDIDEDKTIRPYMEFAQNFNDKSIEEVMIALYEITNSGASELYLNQFYKIFENLKNKIENDKSYKRIRFFENLNVFSIVGSGMIMIILSFAVISLLGGIINGQ